MSRNRFDWSLLDRSTLIGILYAARKEIVGHTLVIEEIHKILSAKVKKKLPVKIKMLRSAEQEDGIIYIGGCYYGDDDQENQKRNIEIVFSYFIWDYSLKITEYRFKRMCEVFADTILHEVIHMRQYRTRNWKAIPGYESTAHSGQQRRNQNYYGHPDEIGAYAFNIACELHDRFGTNWKAARRYLNSNHAVRHRRSNYIRYLKAFDMNHNHPVIKKLKKKIIFYLPYTLIGKPFKTSEYLTS